MQAHQKVRTRSPRAQVQRASPHPAGIIACESSDATLNAVDRLLRLARYDSGRLHWQYLLTSEREQLPSPGRLLLTLRREQRSDVAATFGMTSSRHSWSRVSE